MAQPLYADLPKGCVPELLRQSSGDGSDAIARVRTLVATTQTARQADREVQFQLKGKWLSLQGQSSREGGDAAKRAGGDAATWCRLIREGKAAERDYTAVRRLRVSFEDLKPLREAWQAYADAAERSGHKRAGSTAARMDLHGAELRVAQSPTTSLQGSSGVVLLETSRALVVVTRRSKRPRVWPKRGNVFELATQSGLYHLHGDGMLGRAGAGQGSSGAERAQRVSSSVAYSKRTLVSFRDGAAT